MRQLITANLTERLGRTFICALGVAIGVVLVVLTMGLVRGLLRDRGERDGNLGFEIVASQRGQQGLSLTSLPLTLPVSLADEIRRVPGVRGVTVVGQQLEMRGESGLGIRQIDGVEFDRMAELSRLSIVEGEPLPTIGDFIVVDTRYAAGHKSRPGDRITAMGREFVVKGIYAPETGARMMIPLTTMQEIQNAPGACSMMYISCSTPDSQDEVALRLSTMFPDLRLIQTRDLPDLFAYGYEAFNVFLKLVVLLAAAVSTLVIMLTMYTSVTERTRQIGIMKSLGASKTYIIAVFIAEAIGVGLVGIIAGVAVALGTRWLLVAQAGARISLEPEAFRYAVLVGLLGAVLGAAYPAIRAARQDPIEALSYE